MKFKKHFLIFSVAWAAIVAVVSDVLLISTFREIELDTAKIPSYAFVALVPLGAALVNWLLIAGACVFLAGKLRRKLYTIDLYGEYAFFRNYCLGLAAAAVANTVFLASRFYAVKELIAPDERRRLNLMYSGNIPYRDDRLSQLDSLLWRYGAAAAAVTVILVVLKAAAYLFLARQLVRTFHKNARSGYTTEARG